MGVNNKYYGEEAHNYDKKKRRVWQAEINAFESFLSLIRKSRQRKIDVLDMPCGTGRWIPQLDAITKNYTGVDISKDMLSEAKKKTETINFPSVFIEKGWFEYLPNAEREFDLVICTRFLGYWRKKNVQKIIRLLASTSNQYLILQVRVNESPLQGFLENLFVISGGLEAVRKLKKNGRLTMSHLRKTFLSSLKQERFIVKQKIIVNTKRHSSCEYWLAERLQERGGQKGTHSF
jgi:SAM-dependent methyltransferase